ncbi:hypothetical protein [Amycolatopsis sp. GM8]|uniref:hypothetical protein n=1 Tax=Amycolatopsis sp. GM8 TaxID=2896530 RepID=UPI001F340364|nr:hypothetical protein [Amycolatopsis sp. GM8]
MKRAAAGRAVLGAVALGAVVLLVTSLVHQENAVSAASTHVEPTPEETTETTAPALATQSTPTPKPVPTVSPEESREIADRVEDAVQRSVPSARIGMEVYDRQTGQVLTSLGADSQFSSMSVVKLLIAVDLLARDDGSLPDTAAQNRISRMLSASDDGIASSFWVTGGGPSIITRDVQLMGLTGTEPPATSGEWGDTEVTAQDLVKVYRYVEDELPDDARNLLYNAMYQASETAADGTDQYFGIPDGLPGSTWAIKQGWGSSGSTAFFNTTGLVGKDARYVVIVLTAAPLAHYRELGRALTTGTAQLAKLVSP